MAKVNDLISVAENEVGYLEKATNSNLDGKTANAGNGNWTKYGRDLIKEIGSPYSNGTAWCDMFTDWCFIKAFGKETAKSLLGGWSAYTPTSASYFQNMKQWYTSNPKIGDVIFFKNTTRICHTGIVYNVDTSRVYTIEGNTSGGSQVISNGGSVCKKSYLLTNNSIAGYGRPKYDDNVSINKSATTQPSNITYGMDVSSYQGHIDWSKVKTSNIKFVILRGVLKNGTLDTTFEKNYEGAINNGIHVIGVYQFSYALDEKTAENDAANMVRKLNGKKIDIYLDLEWSTQRNLGKAKVTSIAKAYVNKCRSLGYACHIYSNLDWYKNVYNANELKNMGCKFWIARYPSSDNGTVKETLRPNIGEYIWQYSSKGAMPGIAGNVDLNIIYGNIQSSTSTAPSSYTDNNTESPVEMMGKVHTSSSNLNIRKEPTANSAKVGSYAKGTIVQLLAHTNTGWYKTDKGYVSDDYVIAATGNVANCSKLNMRSEPCVADDNKISVLSAGDKVVLLKKESNGWYKVRTARNQIGYISGSYVTIL